MGCLRLTTIRVQCSSFSILMMMLISVIVLSPPLTSCVTSSSLSPARSRSTRRFSASAVAAAAAASSHTADAAIEVGEEDDIVVNSFLSLPPVTAVDQIVRRYKLYSRCSRKYVQIRGKRVNALGNMSADHAVWSAETEAFGGRVRLQGLHHGGYLCFNDKAKLTVKMSITGRTGGPLCVFRELISTDHFTEFQSVANTSWYVGFRPNGSPLDGQRQDKNSKLRKLCYQFMKTDLRLDDAHDKMAVPAMPSHDELHSLMLQSNEGQEVMNSRPASQMRGQADEGLVAETRTGLSATRSAPRLSYELLRKYLSQGNQQY